MSRDASASELPQNLGGRVHDSRDGFDKSLWVRRVAVLLMAALPALALLNVFGQSARSLRTSTDAATLAIDSPERVRGGLSFTTVITITPRRHLENATLRLDGGWFRGVTYNGLHPQPNSESSSGRWQDFQYGNLSAGESFSVFISWQVNPTNVGRHDQDVALLADGQQVATAHRSIMVFP